MTQLESTQVVVLSPAEQADAIVRDTIAELSAEIAKVRSLRQVVIHACEITREKEAL